MIRGHHPASRHEDARRRKVLRLLKRAEERFADGKIPASLELIIKAKELSPTHLGVLELESKIRWKRQEFREVLACTNDLLTINPFEPGYHSLRGMALRALGFYGEAAKALARDPRATAQLEDLEAFQAKLVRDLIREDQIFSAHYEKDASKALELRGFYFTEPESAVAWVNQQVHPVPVALKTEVGS